MKAILLSLLGVIAVALLGCDSDGKSESAEQAQPVMISGELLYRERILLPADAQVRVRVMPADAQDEADSLTLWQIRSDGQQVPIAFSVPLERALLSEEGLSLQGEILLAGETRWSSDPLPLPSLTDGDTISVGTVLLRAGKPSPAESDPQALAQLTGDAWQVVEIAGAAVAEGIPVTLNFSEEGRINGSSGCNSYMGSVIVGEQRIQISQLAGTLKACSEPQMELEGRFSALLQAVEQYQLDEAGVLRLIDGNGQQIVAQR